MNRQKKANIRRYFQRNLLLNQNITAKNNVVWVADITEIKLLNRKKLYVFLCLDIHTNTVLTYVISTKVLNAHKIIQSLKTVIKKRLKERPSIPAILHTDRGSQFTSSKFYEFIKNFESYIIHSMSGDSQPTDNSVCERYIRTFKNCKINGLKIDQFLNNKLKEKPEFRSYRSIVSTYINKLNNKPNGKTMGLAPKVKDQEVDFASKLMVQPIYTKAYAERVKYDPRLIEIKKFKAENELVIERVQELAKQAEVVSKTPFDYETAMSNKLITKQINELKDLILSNSHITQEYVQTAINPIEESLNDLHLKMDKLLPKKNNHETQKLRDPMDKDLLPIFMCNAGSAINYKKQLRQAQLRICYTILYHAGLRLNEIRYLTEKDIQNAIKISQFSVIHYKTKQAYTHVLTQQAVQDLINLESEINIIFSKNGYKYLFGKQKPMHSKSLIRMVNKDLKATSEVNKSAANIKSHSFRINMISNLLRVTTVQNTATIVGHRDIRSTMKYKRFALTKSEIQDLLNKIQTLK